MARPVPSVASLEIEHSGGFESIKQTVVRWSKSQVDVVPENGKGIHMYRNTTTSEHYLK